MNLPPILQNQTLLILTSVGLLVTGGIMLYTHHEEKKKRDLSANNKLSIDTSKARKVWQPNTPPSLKRTGMRRNVY